MFCPVVSLSFPFLFVVLVFVSLCVCVFVCLVVCLFVCFALRFLSKALLAEDLHAAPPPISLLTF